jgi:hypothetical protein
MLCRAPCASIFAVVERLSQLKQQSPASRREQVIQRVQPSPDFAQIKRGYGMSIGKKRPAEVRRDGQHIHGGFRPEPAQASQSHLQQSVVALVPVVMNRLIK